MPKGNLSGAQRLRRRKSAEAGPNCRGALIDSQCRPHRGRVARSGRRYHTLTRYIERTQRLHIHCSYSATLSPGAPGEIAGQSKLSLVALKALYPHVENTCSLHSISYIVVSSLRSASMYSPSYVGSSLTPCIPRFLVCAVDTFQSHYALMRSPRAHRAGNENRHVHSNFVTEG